MKKKKKTKNTPEMLASWLVPLFPVYYLKTIQSYWREKFAVILSKSFCHHFSNYGRKKLGELSSYSHIHILRLFKTETGISPHDWLTNIRINYAKEYLESTNIKISQIADLCGFSSDSHFKILFKKTTGFTPGNYRKNTNQIY